ncbi:hypothetical protein DFP72DRAFT_1051028 [Ephemerocybe angulata]|uniref:Uncharacterized protein n=1 Tax=Ephemerocybe angulata TaxID=980116 RepID=A0A8H6HGD5_9AGAR|nr:hypothetical protein DFP72DRAFT_1051028 [Tulosesus angulatus]
MSTIEIEHLLVDSDEKTRQIHHLESVVKELQDRLTEVTNQLAEHERRTKNETQSLKDEILILREMSAEDRQRIEQEAREERNRIETQAREERNRIERGCAVLEGMTIMIARPIRNSEPVQTVPSLHYACHVLCRSGLIWRRMSTKPSGTQDRESAMISREWSLGRAPPRSGHESIHGVEGASDETVRSEQMAKVVAEEEGNILSRVELTERSSTHSAGESPHAVKGTGNAQCTGNDGSGALRGGRKVEFLSRVCSLQSVDQPSRIEVVASTFRGEEVKGRAKDVERRRGRLAGARNSDG